MKGQRTAWCAQYDEVTLEPRGARTCEHASLSGQETVAIVRFLMDADRSASPRARIDAAIESAIAWLRSVQIAGQRLERRADASLPSGYDVVVVADAAASPLWARFYEIGTNRPMFSGRDGVSAPASRRSSKSGVPDTPGSAPGHRRSSSGTTLPGGHGSTDKAAPLGYI